ncbi:MAG TPA: thioredoxin domain-containing protein [Gemmatimonadota bacterium]|nr:thioredoxin domain-containing protein [Gemmatimonadota bacterium]
MTPSPPPPRVVVPCPFCGRLNAVDLSRLGDRPSCGACRRPVLLDRPIQLSDAIFDRVIGGSEVPVLVDFHADWCGPCRVMAPTIDELAADRAGRALIGKLDTDRNPATASRFGIRGIPTSIVFRDGREAARRTGAIGRIELDALLDDSRGDPDS